MGPDRAVALRRLYHDMFLGPILEEMSTSGSRGGTSKTTTTASTLSQSAKTTKESTSTTTTMVESTNEGASAKCVVNGVSYQDLETVGEGHVDKEVPSSCLFLANTLLMFQTPEAQCTKFNCR